MTLAKHRKPLNQRAKQLGLSEATVDRAMDRLERLLPHLGEQSQGKQMIGRIAACLLADYPSVVAPCCPDYSHQAGVYDFRSLGNNVPYLAKRQALLLEHISGSVPEAKVELVIADQDTDDLILLRKLKIDATDFTACVDGSVEAMRQTFADNGWEVHKMTERFPDIRCRERAVEEAVAVDSKLRARIVSYTQARNDMCNLFGLADQTSKEAYTARAAAQYTALAQIATEQGFMLCNHEVMNFVWFRENGTAVLHNSQCPG